MQSKAEDVPNGVRPIKGNENCRPFSWAGGREEDGEGCVQVTFEEVAPQLGVSARGGIGLVLLGFFRSLPVTAHM